MKLSQFLGKVFGWVKDNFADILQIVFDSVLKGYLNSIWKITVEEVTRIGTFVDITNEQRRKAAFDSIKERVAAESIVAKDAMINLAIEMAVQYIKKLNR